MELDELKRGWKTMDEQIDKWESKDEVPVSRITQKRTISSQQRLKREYQLMTCVCFMAPSWISILQRNMDGMPDWIVGMFMVFFMVVGAHKGFVWWKLAHWDYKRMTLKEVLVSTYKLEKYQKQGTLLGILLAVPVLACFVAELYLLHEVYALYGVYTGAIVGLFVGLRVRRRLKEELKAMREALDDELN